MKTVAFLVTAQKDIVDIQTYIAKTSGHGDVADKFIFQLQNHCRQLAAIPGVIGRARPDLRPDIRSSTYKNYVIFFRYIGDQFEVVNILEGHRDMDAYFSNPE